MRFSDIVAAVVPGRILGALDTVSEHAAPLASTVMNIGGATTSFFGGVIRATWNLGGYGIGFAQNMTGYGGAAATTPPPTNPGTPVSSGSSNPGGSASTPPASESTLPPQQGWGSWAWSGLNASWTTGTNTAYSLWNAVPAVSPWVGSTWNSVASIYSHTTASISNWRKQAVPVEILDSRFKHLPGFAAKGFSYTETALTILSGVVAAFVPVMAERFVMQLLVANLTAFGLRWAVKKAAPSRVDVKKNDQLVVDHAIATAAGAALGLFAIFGAPVIKPMAVELGNALAQRFRVGSPK